MGVQKATVYKFNNFTKVEESTLEIEPKEVEEFQKPENRKINVEPRGGYLNRRGIDGTA